MIHTQLVSHTPTVYNVIATHFPYQDLEHCMENKAQRSELTFYLVPTMYLKIMT